MEQNLDHADDARPLAAARRSRRAYAAGAVASLVMASALVGGGVASAAPPSVVTCGSLLTQDVTLSADLRCPTGDGLILGTDVTLDLGGHRLTGSGSGIGVQISPDSMGSNTVRNGTIQNWRLGIAFQDGLTHPGVPNRVTDVTLQSAPFAGLPPTQLTRVTAIDSRVDGAYGALMMIDSTLTRSPISVFQGSLAIRNSTLVQSPLERVFESGATVDSSRMDGKGVSAFGRLTGSSLTITNSVVRSFRAPITAFGAVVTLTDNRFTDMPNGVLGEISAGPFSLSYGSASIVGNTFSRSGVVLRGNVPMVVENNTFRQNELGVEFSAPGTLDPSEPQPDATLSRATGNTFMNNSSSGIMTGLPGLQVGSNVSRNNGGYGIYAPGAVDLGGNVAFNNALGDCVGVTCTRR